MGRATAAAALAAALLTAPAALAAPTCWNAAAQTVRCGAPGALPVGTRLTPDQEALRRSRIPEPRLAPLIGLSLLLGGLFALFAILPDFDGWDGTPRRSGRPRA